MQEPRFYGSDANDETGKPAAPQVWSDRKFRALIENSSDVISLLDAHGVVLYKSPSITHVLGFQPEELVGQNSFALTHPEDREMLAGLFVQLLKQPLQTVRGEFRHLHRDGSYRWMEGEASNRLADPELQAIVLNYRDVTERKQGVVELQQIKEKLARTNADLECQVAERTANLREMLAELEQMSYCMVHEMRAPLRSMSSYAQLLLAQARERLTDEDKDFLQNFIASAERMDQLVRDSLNFNQALRVRCPLAPVDAEEALKDLIRSNDRFQPPRAEIRLAGSLPKALANKEALAQCFSRLLDNAVKFVESNRRPEIKIWAERRNGRVRLWFEDNGLGIAKDHQRRIFSMFHQIRAGYEGTGMGLAVVRKLVQRMGGAVGVESEEGSGSRFWIELKAAQPIQVNENSVAV